jgi:hypothetical protein
LFHASKGKKSEKTGRRVVAKADLASLVHSTRGAAEKYALAQTKYKSFLNMNELVTNNATFDLISTLQKTVVDVTITSVESAAPTGKIFSKLRALSELKGYTGFKKVLQIYVKEGQYTAEQLSNYRKSLQNYINNNNLNVGFSVDEITK